MRIEIFSDVVCPWCAIGKAHLDTALAEFEHAGEVEILWRSFELDPGAPPVRESDYATMLAGKYGTTPAAAQAMMQQMTDTAAEAGLEFHLDQARPGNSFDAHRLVHLGADRGRQLEVKQRFLQGYLCEGEPVGEHAALLRLAGQAGLEPGEVGTVLGSDAYADAVRADEQAAGRLQISAVPTFLIDGRLAVPGAQPAATLLQALRRGWAEAHQVVTVGGDTADGAVCGPEGCAR
jgi:predicted DsbA family dithiol-disulfide isomerase